MVSNSSHLSFYTFPGLFYSLLWRGSISSYDGVPVNKELHLITNFCCKQLWPTVVSVIGFHLSEGFHLAWQHPSKRWRLHWKDGTLPAHRVGFLRVWSLEVNLCPDDNISSIPRDSWSQASLAIEEGIRRGFLIHCRSFPLRLLAWLAFERKQFNESFPTTSMVQIGTKHEWLANISGNSGPGPKVHTNSRRDSDTKHFFEYIEVAWVICSAMG